MFFSFFSFLKFIVVSLKEGMFNNANVLFKTKFVDGVSTVARFTQSQAGKIPKEAKSRGKEPNWVHASSEYRLLTLTFLHMNFQEFGIQVVYIIMLTLFSYVILFSTFKIADSSFLT